MILLGLPATELTSNQLGGITTALRSIHENELASHYGIVTWHVAGELKILNT